MKIVAGASTVAEAAWLIDSPADEVYFGLTLLHNHRYDKSLRSVEEMLQVLAMGRARRKPLYLAMNEIYAERDYPRALRLVRLFEKHGGTGLMLRDPGLMMFLREKGCKKPFVLSTLAHCFNSATLAFYARLGVSRAVLPQHLSPEEARGVIRNPHGIETEVFYLPDGFCRNIDGACRYHYLPRTAAGRASGAVYNCELCLPRAGGELKLPKVPYDECMRRIRAFRRLGVKYFKLPRDHDFDWARRCLGVMLEFRKKGGRG